MSNAVVVHTRQVTHEEEHEIATLLRHRLPGARVTTQSAWALTGEHDTKCLVGDPESDVSPFYAEPLCQARACWSPDWMKCTASPICVKDSPVERRFVFKPVLSRKQFHLTVQKALLDAVTPPDLERFVDELSDGPMPMLYNIRGVVQLCSDGVDSEWTEV